jgi:hypothetical protein
VSYVFLNIAGGGLLKPTSVFIFPFPILRSLRFTGRREKIGLALIFALGAITIIVSTVRFMFMLYLVNDVSLCKTRNQASHDTEMHNLTENPR